MYLQQKNILILLDKDRIKMDGMDNVLLNIPEVLISNLKLLEIMNIDLLVIHLVKGIIVIENIKKIFLQIHVILSIEQIMQLDIIDISMMFIFMEQTLRKIRILFGKM